MFYKLLSKICNNNIRRNHILIMNLIYIWLKFFYVIYFSCRYPVRIGPQKKISGRYPVNLRRSNMRVLNQLSFISFKSAAALWLVGITLTLYITSMSLALYVTHTVWIIPEQFDWKLMLMKKRQKKTYFSMFKQFEIFLIR